VIRHTEAIEAIILLGWSSAVGKYEDFLIVPLVLVGKVALKMRAYTI
jgi:hypothetical protein